MVFDVLSKECCLMLNEEWCLMLNKEIGVLCFVVDCWVLFFSSGLGRDRCAWSRELCWCNFLQRWYLFILVFVFVCFYFFVFIFKFLFLFCCFTFVCLCVCVFVCLCVCVFDLDVILYFIDGKFCGVVWCVRYDVGLSFLYVAVCVEVRLWFNISVVCVSGRRYGMFMLGCVFVFGYVVYLMCDMWGGRENGCGRFVVVCYYLTMLSFGKEWV